MKKSLRLSTAVALAATATLTLASCGFGGGSEGDASGATTIDLLVPSYSDATRACGKTSSPGSRRRTPTSR